MTSMQNDAISMIQKMPEEQLSALLVIMHAMHFNDQESEKGKKHRDFLELEQLRRPIPNLDPEKELAEWREEKFGNADLG